MKTKYSVIIISLSIIIACFSCLISLTLPHKSNDQISKHIKPVCNKQSKQAAQTTHYQYKRSINSDYSQPEGFQVDSSPPNHVESSQPSTPDIFYNEKEMTALYNDDEILKAIALRNLDNTPVDRQILIDALTDQSPLIRNSSLERVIEIEDPTNRSFESDVNTVLMNEEDNTVIETALSYYSLTEDEATYDAVQYVLNRSDLSGQVLAYAGEILHDDYKMDKNSIYQLLSMSPSFKELDHSQLMFFNEKLTNALHDESE